MFEGTGHGKDLPKPGQALSRTAFCQRRRRKMRAVLGLPILAVMLAAFSANSAEAAYGGLFSFRNAGCCEPATYECCKQQCYTVNKTCKETVYEKQEQTCYKTVYETVYEDKTVDCVTYETETRYKDCTYTTCKPVWETKYRTVNYTTCKPVWETRTKDICYTVCKPVWETKT
eukprot:CAMPEP_0201143550 /NCGR_PEP_ID=MMETSP0851-20130426/5269_1 /ASSEMBLY_ACC=CAM_ASM_000631 /TAXON_ID=183588 /ORGANISM="Pseudo-nitzschia fraudulenta, Strain WWA7" /LENGTH=172 /DNA_ID=CAMNT_0047417843 /DNA_START=97 /DNA_END=611 /DNA_ORIENTATION=+